MAIRTVIVDDEPPARQKIKSFLEHEADVEVIAECGDGPQAVNVIRRESPDLLFLDIEMPGLDGLEVIEEVGSSKMPVTVFVTAFDKYAVKAGGGENHRLALWDMYLVKENHIRAAGGIGNAIDRIARTRQGDLLLEVEVESIDELREALRPEVDRILLDNRSVEEVQMAVAEVDRWCAVAPADSPRRPTAAKRWPEMNCF